jgi:vacuolar-type H+-ATPase subunit C/Vma6
MRPTKLNDLHVVLDKYYYTKTSAPILSRRQEEQLVNILADELDNNRKNIIKITKELKEIL